MQIVILIVIALLCLFIWSKIMDFVMPYFVHHDNVIIYTGTAGSGKTLSAVRKSVIRRYQASLNKQAFRFVFFRLMCIFTRGKWSKKHVMPDKPELFSSIPIYYHNHWSLPLPPLGSYMNWKIPVGSVVFIDEVGLYFSQMDYKLTPRNADYDLFMRLFRHITKGGYLVMTDQSIDNVAWFIKRRCGMIYHLSSFSKLTIFGFGIGWTHVRELCSVEGVNTNITQSKQNKGGNYTESTRRIYFLFLPWKRKEYDTYAFSNFRGQVEHDPVLIESYKFTTDDLKRDDILVPSASSVAPPPDKVKK